MNIRDILLILVIIYVFYLHNKINKNKNIEKFAVTDDIRAAVKEIYSADMDSVRKLTPIYDIKAAVKEIYNTDMEAVRQLSDMAAKLSAGGLEIPGNLIVKGNITNTGSINTASNINVNGTINSIGNIESNSDIRIYKISNNDKIYTNTLNSVLGSVTSLSSSVSNINSNNKLFTPIIINLKESTDRSIQNRIFVLPNKFFYFILWSDDGGSSNVRSWLLEKLRNNGFSESNLYYWDGRIVGYRDITFTVPTGKIMKIYGWDSGMRNYNEGLHQLRLDYSPHLIAGGFSDYNYMCPDNLNVQNRSGL